MDLSPSHTAAVSFVYDKLLSTPEKKKLGHRLKIHKITPVKGKERDDLEIKDYVVLQKPQEQDDRLPSPRTLIMDFTLTHT